MIIRYKNAEYGITEEYSQMELEFIKRSYEEFAEKDMSRDDYIELAQKITMAKYDGSRYSEAQWELEVED
jgi:hypothetical protein